MRTYLVPSNYIIIFAFELNIMISYRIDIYVLYCQYYLLL